MPGPSEDSGVNKQESTNQELAAPVTASLSTRPLTPPPTSANANETAASGLSQSQCV